MSAHRRAMAASPADDPRLLAEEERLLDLFADVAVLYRPRAGTRGTPKNGPRPSAIRPSTEAPPCAVVRPLRGCGRRVRWRPGPAFWLGEFATRAVRPVESGHARPAIRSDIRASPVVTRKDPK
jgi:hypothetical protein